MCANDKLMLLWLSLNCQIEDGQNKVKQLSMEVISKLWKISGKPSEQVVDYLMELLSSLMVLLFSDCDEPLGDIILFEKSLSKCLNVIFEVTTKPVHHLSALHITGILDSLVQGLTTYGLSKLKTVELKFSVCHVLHYIYTYVTAGYESDVATRLERTQSVNNALIDHIGKETNSQYLVGVLYQTIENDLQLNKHKAAADS
ncbi:serine/threonine-protein kinase ATR-like, partial [Saccoglossus kowalevskii]